MKSRMKRIVTGIIIPLVLSLALPAVAKQVRGEDFEKGLGEFAGKSVSTPLGRGWVSGVGGNSNESADMLQFPATGLLNPAGGTIEIDVVRNNTADTSEALFALVNRDGRVILSVSVEWEGARAFSTPLLEISGHSQSGKSLFTSVSDYGVVFQGQPFPSDIRVGTSFHLSFAWGPRASDCAFSLDGRELRGEKSSGIVEDLRQNVQDAVWLYVGGEPRLAPEKGANNLMTSVLKSVNVYDQPINGNDLYANPGKYRQSALPVIAAVGHDAPRVAGFSGKLTAGTTLGVTLNGAPGATATFDIAHYPDAGAKLLLDWKGWGVYLEDKVFFEPGEVNLRDVKEYRVYGSSAPFDPLAPGMEPVATLAVGEQSYSFEMLEVDKPFYTAVVAEMKDGGFKTVIAPLTGLPLTETAPGVYTGTKLIAWGERYPRAVVIGRLAKASTATSMIDVKTFQIDTALTIAVATTPSELKADEKSKSQISVSVTDANGNPVSGHKMKFLLATTSQYTGVVGGGAFTDQVGGSLDENRWMETDLFGRVTATYVAGFAAKTAIVVVRDMVSNDTGAGWVKTFITATAQLELLPVRSTPAMDAGYTITVTSSDQWLTADGKSQARITAKVALNGRPVEGHNVDFAVSSGSGSIRAVKNTTDRNGEARAVYTAGKKIGIALITATDTTAGISGSVPIELRSDAPAKIAIKVDPEQLPADGRSRAELLVTVTDINDNPNDNVEVEYDLRSGGGRLRDTRGLTDRRGESTSEYTAGNTAGMVTIEITVRSTVPTAEELAKARDLAVSVTDFNFF